MYLSFSARHTRSTSAGHMEQPNGTHGNFKHFKVCSFTRIEVARIQNTQDILPFSTKVADISELMTHFRDMSLISLDNTLQTITEDFHISTPTKRLIKQQTHEGKWYRYTEWQKNRYFLLVPCLMQSCFLGVWATFALASLLFPENVMRTCRTDISDNTRSGLLQHKCHGQRFGLVRDHHDIMPSWHCHDNILSDKSFEIYAEIIMTTRQVDITSMTQVKSASTQRRWSRCAQHDKLRSSLLTRPRTDICLYITNRWHRLYTVTHPKPRDHRPHALTSTWDCCKHILSSSC